MMDSELLSSSSSSASSGSSSASEAGSDDEAPRCRICYEAGGPLLAPCDCGGSMKFVHAACLGRWLAASQRFPARGCDVCRAPWKVGTPPTLRGFVRACAAGGVGSRLARRWLAHVGRPGPAAAPGAAADDDDDADPGDGGAAAPGDDGEAVDLLANGAGWEAAAVGLPGLVPEGGLAAEASGAVVRLVVWAGLFALAVAQARAALRLFGFGVKASVENDLETRLARSNWGLFRSFLDR